MDHKDYEKEVGKVVKKMRRNMLWLAISMALIAAVVCLSAIAGRYVQAIITITLYVLGMLYLEMYIRTDKDIFDAEKSVHSMKMMDRHIDGLKDDIRKLEKEKQIKEKDDTRDTDGSGDAAKPRKDTGVKRASGSSK